MCLTLNFDLFVKDITVKAIINANIYDYHSLRPGSYVLFDGQIREVGSMADFPGSDEILDAKDGMLLPGMVVGHAHVYGAFLRGITLPYNPESFREILKQLYWRLDGGLDLESTYHSARVFGLEHIKYGVTTILDHHASGTAIRGTLAQLKKGICDETGMRGVFCFETSDRFDVDDCIAENLEFAGQRGPNFAGMFGMHASLSVSQETLRRISEVLGDIAVHVHVGESLEDEELSVEHYGRRIVQRFDDFGLLNQNSLLAHCVNIDETEARVIAERGCTVAMNVLSNMNTSVGLPNHALFKEHGIRAVVGNDSLGVNLASDYRATLYSQHLRQKSAWRFSYGDLLQCIRNVYDYAGELLNIKLGRIEPGYEADLITVPYLPSTPMHEGNIFGHMVDGVFAMFRPSNVWCAGRQLVSDYQTGMRESEIYAGARKAAGQVWKRIGGK